MRADHDPWDEPWDGGWSPDTEPIAVRRDGSRHARAVHDGPVDGVASMGVSRGPAGDARTRAESAPGTPAARPAAPPLVSLPSSVRGAVTSVSWPAVAGLVALLVVAGVVLGARVLAAQSAAAPVPVRATTPPPMTPASAGASGTPGASASTRVVVVDVTGAVRRPGVQRLPSGSRVVDAIVAAGGTTPDAEVAGLNRARALVDGELLHLPRPGEKPPVAAARAAGPGAAGSAGGQPGSGSGSGSGPGAAAAPGAPIDLNTADAAALDTLPGVGPALAGRILAWRTEHGRFSSVDELGEVSGIGDKTLERLRPFVKV